MTSLPGILADIAEVAGEHAALAIAEMKGGTTIWIPAEVTAEHWLAEAVGLATARKIAAHFRVLDRDGRATGFRITVPLGTHGVLKRARRQLIEALREGKDPAQAAREVGLHERTAYRIQAKLRGRINSTQGELF